MPGLYFCHTNFYPTRDAKIGFHTLPVKLYLFKGGLFVRAARREQAARNFEKALGLNPKSYEASERLKEARRR